MKALQPLVLLLATLPAITYGGPSATEIDQANREAIRLQQLQEQQFNQQRQEQLLNRPKTNIEFETPAVKQPVDDGVCREITTIEIEGATVLPESKRKSFIQPYEGSCMGVGSIEKLLATITNYYLEKGYISARVYVQAQDLSSGVLKLLVLEGRVEKLMLEDGQGNHSVNMTTAFPFVEGDLFNLRYIEQGLDQINRLSSNAATMKVEPGSQAGTSVIVIQNQPTRRLHANLTYDTYGPTSTGEDQVGASFSLDNPLQLNDFVMFTHRRSVEGAFDTRHSRSNAFFYSVPFGRLTLNASHTWADYRTTLDLLGGPLVAKGTSLNSALGAEFVVYRDQYNRVSLTGNLARKESENYLAGQYLGVSSRVLSVADVGLGWATRVFDGPLSMNVSRSQGLTVLGAMTDASGLPDSAPRAQFAKWTAGANWNRHFQVGKYDFIYNSTFSGQVGVDVLYGQEQFQIGSIYSVRGYRNTSIIGDTGYFWRNDVAMPVPFEMYGQPFILRPYIGYDMGAIRSRNDVPGGRLTGVAMGVSATFNRFALDISGVKPLDMPSERKDEGFQFFTKANINF